MDAELAVRAVARALALPPGGPLLLGLVGVGLVRRAPRLGRALAAAGLLALLALSLPVVADLLALAVERYPPLDESQPLTADAIVVLAGDIRYDSRGAAPTPTTLERLVGAAALARRTGLPLVVSGGTVVDGPAEAEVMQQSLKRDFGLEVRIVERHSRTTRENARDTARVLAPLALKRVVLVTSALHMRRALAEFAAAGLDARPAPVGSTTRVGVGLLAWLPSMAALERSHAALYEVAGELVARLGRGA